MLDIGYDMQNLAHCFVVSSGRCGLQWLCYLSREGGILRIGSALECVSDVERRYIYFLNLSCIDIIFLEKEKIK